MLNNPFTFYKFNELSNNTGIAPLKSLHRRNFVLWSRSKANSLNEYFRSVYTVDNGSNPPSRLSTDATLKNDANIKPEKVREKILQSLKPALYRRFIILEPAPPFSCFGQYYCTNVNYDSFILCYYLSQVQPILIMRCTEKNKKRINNRALPANFLNRWSRRKYRIIQII